MSAESDRIFPPFRLDLTNQELWRGSRRVILRPKSFDVLCYLVEHSGQLVTKSALLDTLWPDVTVGDSLPANSVKEIRKALGDDADAPRFIETVQRRGYRFIAPIRRVSEQRALEPVNETAPPSLMVGREAESAQLDRWFEQVREKKRMTLFVTGEAGIGKTTFVQNFLDSLSPDRKTRIGRGQCIEQYGAGEPYMPVLEALSRIARGCGGESVREVLSRFAPTWLAQMPELLNYAERNRAPDEMRGVTQQRMLREMAQALDALTAEEPLVLLLEDLHWSDFSTLELISAIARRPDPACLLIIGTYRPVEVLARDNPLRGVKQELELHNQCQELRLKLLGKENVAEYLSKRLTSSGVRTYSTLAPFIHSRTDGNPLFMVNVVDYLLEKAGLDVQARDTIEAVTLAANGFDPPRNICEMIEHNLERLTADEQAVLVGASVVGAEFSAVSVAAALERSQDDVEACCARLSRREQFVTAQDPITWPDGTIATRFRFHHALYQEVLYDRLPAVHQLRLHQRIALRAEAGYGDRAAEVAAELAYHYSRANEKHKAIRYCQLAGERALSQSAMVEAERHFSNALDLLARLPETAERDRNEFAIRMSIGSALFALKGAGTRQMEANYCRARELCAHLGNPPTELSSILFGLWALNNARGETLKGYDFALQLLGKAQDCRDRSLLRLAENVVGYSLYWLGQFADSRNHFEAAAGAGGAAQNESLMARHLSFDAEIGRPFYLAWILWQLGYAAQSLDKAYQGLEIAQRQAHITDIYLAWNYIGVLHQFRGETLEVKQAAACIDSLCAQHEIVDWLGWATDLRSWVMGVEGRHKEAATHFRESLARADKIGERVGRPHFLCLLAENYIDQGLFDEALSALSEALAIAEKQKLRYYEPETHRLLGKLLLKQGDSKKADAQRCFERAVETAQNLGAKSLELRATTSFARMLAKQGQSHAALTMLAKIYNWFTEGFDTKDLKDAKALLDELEAPASR